MKRLAIIIPTLYGGGAERIAALVSKCLEDTYNITFFVNQFTDKTYEHFGEIVSIDSLPANNLIGKVANIFIRTFKLKRLKRKYKIDISMSFMEGSNFINILSKNKEKVIVSVRTNVSSQESNSILKKLGRLLIKLLYNHADWIACVSKFIASDLNKSYGIKKEKLLVLYNPIDLDYINRLKDEELDFDTVYLEEVYGKNPSVTYVGRLTTAKSLSNLVKSFYVLKGDLDNAKLIMIGEGEEKNDILRLAKKFGLEDDIILLGRRQNPYKYICKSGLLTLTSIREGMPNTILEAMACGTPVVSTNCKSGPIEILSELQDYDLKIEGYLRANYGILVDCFSENVYDMNITKQHINFAEAMKAVLMDNQCRIGYSIMGIERVRFFNHLTFKKNIISMIED